MRSNRRSFVKSSAAIAGIGAVGALSSRLALGKARLLASGEERKLTVLVMGGTKFLGPPIVEKLVANGHTVALFNRGKTNPGMFPDLEKLIGDRKSDVSALKGRKFDAVIDTNGYFPDHVTGPLEALGDGAGHYVFVSTCSVYPEMGEVPLHEESKVAEISDEDAEKATAANQIMPHYGALKVRCERAAEKMLPGRVSVVRPGLIVGRLDDTDRFTYWPARIAKGGEVLAPGKPTWEIQFTDVLDVAAFCVLVAEKRASGTYNVDGLEKPVPMGVLLEECKKVTKSDAKLTWVDMKFLEAQKVQPWNDLPAWFPPPEGKDQVPSVSCKKAIALGLTFRPLADSIQDALAHHASRGPDYKPRWKMTAEREQAVLAAWHEEQG